jgi:hypothetical protein
MRKTCALAMLVVALLASGCANIPIDRTKVQKMPPVDLVRVATPPMPVMTLMQAYVKNTVAPGLLPAGIAESQNQTLFSAPAIQDIGLLLTDGLRKRIPQAAPWWPPMTPLLQPVAGDYVHAGKPWLRVEVTRLEIAPVPLRTLFAVVNVSLRDAGNQPMWVFNKAFSGVVHGGEKIDMAKLPGDLSQLRREIDRAVDWLVAEIAADIK